MKVKAIEKKLKFTKDENAPGDTGGDNGGDNNGSDNNGSGNAGFDSGD